MLKNAVFWDMTPCDFCKSRVLEEPIISIIRGERISELGTTLAVTNNYLGIPKVVPSSLILSTLMTKGNIFLRIVGSYKSNTALHPRRRNSS
jgi:hypothetical protein